MTHYHQVLDYLYNRLPVFQKEGVTALNYKLDKILAMCEDLGSPHLAFKSIHIAGTNGKGSTSHYIASSMQESGYKVGLYTSPHLKEFTERIKINGQEIGDGEVVQFVNEIKPMIEKYNPSFFEVTVLMAFYYFSQQSVDIAIIEVGLGGRFDSTNIITPLLSVITNIGLDHQFILGDTLVEIATEKAGIVKEKIPVIIGQRQPEIESVFVNRAKECNSQLFWAEDIKFVPAHTSTYLEKNQITAFAALKYLRDNELFNINLENCKDTFLNVSELTGLKGRWQALSENPMVVCDTGHNVDGIKMILAQLKRYKFNKLIAILGFVSDKKKDEILTMLPKDAFYISCEAKIDRAMNADDLSKEMDRKGLDNCIVKDVNDALTFAKSIAKDNDFIWVGGSTFVVAEIEEL